MKRILSGKVVKKSGEKTVAVLVASKHQHMKYSKTVSTSKKYLVHDPKGTAVVDSVVRIRETRPISARKHWTIVYDS